MVERDYILRLIKQMTEALAIIFRLERGGDYLEALRVIDSTYQQLLGLDANTVASLPAEALLPSFAPQALATRDSRRSRND